MNAGKTMKLLQSSFNYRERGMNTLLYTSAYDTRFGKSLVASRIGISEQANTFEPKTNIYEDVNDIIAERTNNNISNCTPGNIHCVFIDEAQFLTKEQVKQLCQIVDELNIPVLTYGLRSDFLGEPFEGSKYLLIYADELIEVKTICFCGKKAIMNAKFDANNKIVRTGDQIDIGGNEKYISLCRKHFNEGRLK